MSMRRPATPLRLVDAMALVAMTALGLVLTRAVSPRRYLLPYLPSASPGDEVELSEIPILSPLWLRWAVTTLEHRFIYFAPLVAAWTLTVLTLSLRGPRRSWPSLMRRPGTVAGLAACAGFAFAAARLLVSARTKGLSDQPEPMLLTSTGMAVIGAWSVLAASGRWRTDRSLLDRAGLLLGLLWIMMGPLADVARIATFW